MKLLATEIQRILNVPDYNYDSNNIIAYGYTFYRDTIEIYFEKGLLVRETSDRDKLLKRETSEYFEPTWFQIKRFYVERTNKKLIDLFKTFNECGLPLTTGGKP